MVATVLHSIHADRKQYRSSKGIMGDAQLDIRANKTGCVILILLLAFSVLVQFASTSQLFKMKEILLFGLSLTVVFNLSAAQGEFQLHSGLACFN